MKILSKITNTSNLAIRPCLNKVYRVIKSDKDKRGNARQEFRRHSFTIPTETVSASKKLY